jgi:hypothetical protein
MSKAVEELQRISVRINPGSTSKVHQCAQEKECKDVSAVREETKVPLRDKEF